MVNFPLIFKKLYRRQFYAKINLLIEKIAARIQNYGLNKLIKVNL
jgi:hypothetical protein